MRDDGFVVRGDGGRVVITSDGGAVTRFITRLSQRVMAGSGRESIAIGCDAGFTANDSGIIMLVITAVISYQRVNGTSVTQRKERNICILAWAFQFSHTGFCHTDLIYSTVILTKIVTTYPESLSTNPRNVDLLDLPQSGGNTHAPPSNRRHLVNHPASLQEAVFNPASRPKHGNTRLTKRIRSSDRLYQSRSGQSSTRDEPHLLSPKSGGRLWLLAHGHAAHEAVLTPVARASLPERAVAVTHVDGVDVAFDLDAGALAEAHVCAGPEGDDAAALHAGGAGVAGLGRGLGEVRKVSAGGHRRGARGGGGEGGEAREGEKRRETHCEDVGLLCYLLLLRSCCEWMWWVELESCV